MSEQMSAAEPRFTVLTLGVDDVGKSSAFYRALGFTRRLKEIDVLTNRRYRQLSAEKNSS